MAALPLARSRIPPATQASILSNNDTYCFAVGRNHVLENCTSNKCFHSFNGFPDHYHLATHVLCKNRNTLYVLYAEFPVIKKEEPRKQHVFHTL